MTTGNGTSNGNSTDSGIPSPWVTITDMMPFMGLAGVEDLSSHGHHQRATLLYILMQGMSFYPFSQE